MLKLAYATGGVLLVNIYMNMIIKIKRLSIMPVLSVSMFQVAKLQDDNRALDRLTKSKEAALLEAERTVQIAMAKASLVDDLQNKNQELMKQVEICQVRLPKIYCVL